MEMIAVTRILLFSMTLLTSGLPHVQSTSSDGCPDGWTGDVNGPMCYKYKWGSTRYITAKYMCSGDGGEIIMPKTQEEDTFISMFISGYITWYAWIGLKYVETKDEWTWEDGQPLNYSNWKEGHSSIASTRCTFTKANDPVWETTDCYWFTAAVFCQRKKITCTNVIKELNTTGTLTNISGYNYKDTLTYSCEPNTKFVGGDLLRTCTENGKWNGTEPLCKEVICSNETSNLNSSEALTDISGYNYNDNLTYTCEPPYYKLVGGDVLRRCTENGTWSGTEPECEKVICTNETSSLNSSGTLTDISGYNYNDNLTYTCEPPYYKLVNGDVLRRCTKNGTWSGTEPECEKVICTNETSSLNSSGTLTGISGYNYNDNLTYSCEPPYYKLVDGDVLRRCNKNGTWSGTEPECEKVICTNETSSLNSSGTLTCILGYNYNDNLTYSCEPPYYKLVDGDVLRRCTKNGTWSGTEPECEKNNSSSAELITKSFEGQKINTIFNKTGDEVICTNETSSLNSTGTLTDISGYNYNDKLTYSCEPPYYKLVGGDVSRRCTKNGTWSGTEPECEKITCPNETTYLNSSGTLVWISGYGHNDILVYSCDPPYYNLVDGDLTRICTENGTWSGKEPLCEQITCPNETTYLNSSGKLVLTSGYVYNDTLLYSCEPPYYNLVEGDLTRICTENGTWSGVEPLCERVTCTDEEKHLNTSGDLTEISGYSYNDTLTYSCEPPNRTLLQGELKRTCSQSGNWSGIEPVCKKCMCPCRKTKSTSIFTPEKIEEMVNEMKVSTKNTSKATRRKTSAKDDRPSAEAAGCIGIIMLVVVGLVIIVPDMPVLHRDMKRGLRNMKSFIKRFRKKRNKQKQKE